MSDAWRHVFHSDSIQNTNMGKLRHFIPLAFLLLGCTGLERKQQALKSELEGTVVKIIDGDTFDLLTKEKSTVRIRMKDIDCPERNQDYYQVAKDALGSLIFKKKIHLITFGKDRYKRILANVYSNGENVNLVMINNGHAWHYKKYSSDIIYANAEIIARHEQRGLWQMPDPVAPWDFRKN